MFSATVSEATQASTLVLAGLEFAVTIQEGAVALDAPAARYLWEIINDSQSNNWTTVNGAQNAGWSIVNDSQNATWSAIKTQG